MEITADITGNDYKSFVQYVHRKAARLPSNKIFAPLWHFANAAAWIFIIFLFMLVLRMFGMPIDIPTAIVSLVTYYVISLWFQVRLQNKTYFDDKGFMLGPKNYVIDDNGIFEKKDYYESRTQWPAVKSLEETKDCFFIMIDKSVGHIIPKRSFSNQSQIEQFLSLIRRSIETTKSSNCLSNTSTPTRD